MIAAARLLPVGQIIGAHDRSRPAAFDRNLEGEQVAFAVRGLVDLGVPAVAVGLVRIEREMLDRRHDARRLRPQNRRSEEHTSEPQSLMRISYAVFCLKKKTTITTTQIVYRLNRQTQNQTIT